MQLFYSTWFSFLQASEHKEMQRYSAAPYNVIDLKHKLHIIVKQNKNGKPHCHTVTTQMTAMCALLSEGVIPQA